jgi:hypothetical protein
VAGITALGEPVDILEVDEPRHRPQALPAPSASAGHDVDQRDEGDYHHCGDRDDCDGGRGEDHGGDHSDVPMSSRGDSVCGSSAARSAA